MIEITSKSNDHVKRWIELSTSRGIKKHNEFILMGEKLIGEFLENPHFKIKAELLTEGLHSLATKINSANQGKVSSFKISKALFNEIDVVGTHWNLLVLEPKPIAALNTPHQIEGLEILCPLGDPSNLGALSRSALAFGASKIILTEESCNPYHPKAIKASAGAILKIPLFKTGKIQEHISTSDEIYALDMKGENINRFPWPRSLQLAVGEEGPGLGNIKGLKRLKVPTESVESLNANVAASIALYSYACYRKN